MVVTLRVIFLKNFSYQQLKGVKGRLGRWKTLGRSWTAGNRKFLLDNLMLFISANSKNLALVRWCLHSGKATSVRIIYYIKGYLNNASASSDLAFKGYTYHYLQGK
jgi:hypothetical protein